MQISEMFAPAGAGPAIPITPLAKSALAGWVQSQPPPVANWVAACRFAAEAASVCLLPAMDGGIGRVLLGRGEEPAMWDWAALPAALLPGLFRIDADLDAENAGRAALAWALGGYRFDRYVANHRVAPTLVWPETADGPAVVRIAAAIARVRDLINTPAEDLGPEQLAAAADDLARGGGGRMAVLSGDELLAHNYPAIFAVGRASARPPRLIDLRWGDDAAPRLSLVGKGVCFDSGGLDLKTASQMLLMKKDMGGAALMLGLAELVMGFNLNVRLRLLIPAVENSVAGNALRPLDVIRTRRGLSVEIGNTDAEGRLILADALAEASRERPDLLIDAATLTGAARVALGTELPALFCADDTLAAKLTACGLRSEDPLWRLPLWKPYRRHLKGKTADLTNAPDLPYAGAITAALFLREFVDPGTAWMHLDVMAWNTDSRPGRPEGGEAMGLRALLALLQERYSVA